MEKSKVYFTDFRTVLGVSLTEKLQKLIKKAWIDPDKCVGCGRCIGACAFDAIENINGNAPEKLGDNMADEHFHDHGDVWHNSNPKVSWAETLEQAEKIGIGTRDYELITMK